MGEVVTGVVRKLFRKPKPDDQVSLYGFIKGDDGQDRFTIPSLLNPTWTWDELKEGMRVQFESTDHPSGKRAHNVDIIG